MNSKMNLMIGLDPCAQKEHRPERWAWWTMLNNRDSLSWPQDGVQPKPNMGIVRSCSTFLSWTLSSATFSPFSARVPSTMFQDGTQSQDGPKMAARRPQDDPTLPQDGPRLPQDGPSEAKHGLAMAHDGCKMAQASHNTAST